MAIYGDVVWAEKALRNAGLTVRVYPGAYARGNGDMGLVNLIVDHHTGAPAGSNPGPGAIANHPTLGLCSQLHLDRNGVYTLCGVGIAYHAGQGSYPGQPTNNINPTSVGIEAENSGTEGWGSKQYWAYVEGNAALLKEMKEPHTKSIGHKEWAKVQGKWDPGGLNMDKFRADIKEAMNPPAVIPVRNEINHVYGFSGWLGKRLFKEGEERDAANGGKYVDFENGSIYFHPDAGAIPVPTLVYEVWKRHDWERGPLGYPQRYHVVYKDEGDLQSFAGTGPEDRYTIARKYGTEGFVLHGVIGRRWLDEGGVRGIGDVPSRLGWPTTNEYDFDGGRRQDFERGSLIWHPSGAVELIN